MNLYVLDELYYEFICAGWTLRECFKLIRVWWSLAELTYICFELLSLNSKKKTNPPGKDLPEGIVIKIEETLIMDQENTQTPACAGEGIF